MLKAQPRIRERIRLMVAAQRIASGHFSAGGPFKRYEAGFTVNEQLNAENESRGGPSNSCEIKVCPKNIMHVTSYGTIHFSLAHGYKVDITMDQSILLTNNDLKTSLSISACGKRTAMIHPSGRVYQYDSNVDIVNNEGYENFKYIKMTRTGISIAIESSINSAYFVDANNTNRIYDSFTGLKGDGFIHEVFYNGSRTGPQFVKDVDLISQSIKYWENKVKTKYFKIGNVRISQTVSGRVHIVRNDYKYSLRSCPTDGTAEITSDIYACNTSENHLYIESGGKSMFRDISELVVRHGENMFECC